MNSELKKIQRQTSAPSSGEKKPTNFPHQETPDQFVQMQSSGAKCLFSEVP